MRPRVLARALRGCVSGPGRDLWELHGALARPAGVALVGAAERHGVVGHLWIAARTAPYVHPHVTAVLEEAYAHTKHLRSRGLADLARLGRVLDRAGILWAVVKGPILAETVYPHPELRSYRDVDVLVPPAAFSAAQRALEAAGARPLDREAALLRAERTGSAHLTLPGGSLCDLHWHLLGDREWRRSFRLPTDTLLRRSRRIVCGGVELAALDPVDGFLHLALDTCLSGADRLIRMKDLDEMVRAWGPSGWSQVVGRSLASGSSLAVAGMLELTREMFGTPLPPGLREELDPAGVWTRIVALSRRLSPPALTPGGGSALVMVTGSTRATLAASLQQLIITSKTLLSPGSSPSHRGRGARTRRATIPTSPAQLERTAHLYAVTSTPEHPAA